LLALNRKPPALHLGAVSAFKSFKKKSMTNTRNRKILIVEDEPDMCLLLNILLADKKVELHHVQAIADAQYYLEANNPDIIILDNKLPDGYGIDIIPYFKKTNPGCKIIMVSGLPAAKDVALENGADAFLEKPLTRRQLVDSVDILLNQSTLTTK
jgi:DNA-binding response OmpR family regulator